MSTSTPPPESPPETLDFAAEVGAYERRAAVERWDGPRYRMTYRVLGEGPTLVVVQGLASTYRGYAPFLNRLAGRFRTVIYDYPGENPDDGADLATITHDDLTDDLRGLLDRLGGERVSAFAASFGSTVLLETLRRDPARVVRAAIQGGFACRPMSGSERAALRLGRRLPGRMADLPLRRPVLAWHNRHTFPRAVVADRWPIFVAENGQTQIAGMAHRLDLMAAVDLRPALGAISVPILLIHGDADGIVPIGYFDILRTGLPQAEAVLWPGVGHQPHYTHPERLAEAVEAFLDRQSSEAG